MEKSNALYFTLVVMNAALVFVFPFWGPAGADQAWKQFIFYGFILFFFLLLAFRLKEGQSLALPFSGAGKFLAALLLAALVSAAFSYYRLGAFFGLGTSAVISWLTLLGLASLFFMVFAAILKKEQLYGLVKLNLWIFCLVVVFSILSIFGFGNLGGFFDFSFASAFGSLEELSLLLAVLNVLFFALFINGRVWERLAFGWRRLLWLFSYAASLILLLLINFSGAWLSLIGGYLIVLALHFLHGDAKQARKNLWLMAMVALPLLLLFAGSLNSGSFSQERLRGTLVLDAGRSTTVVLSALGERPLFGFGEGAYDALYSRYRPAAWNGLDDWTVRYQQPASGALGFLSAYGALGMLFYLLFVFFVLRRLWQANRLALQEGQAVTDSFGYGVFVALCGLFASLFLAFFTAGFNLLLWFYFFLTLALSLRAARFLSAQGQPLLKFASFDFSQNQLRKRSAMLFVFGFVVFWLAVFSVGAKHLAAESFYLAGAKETGSDSLKKAVLLSPSNLKYNLALAKREKNEAQAFLSGRPDADLGRIKDLIDDSLNHARQAERGFPLSPLPKTVLGAIYSDLSAYSQESAQHAIAAYLEAAQREPTNPLNHLSVARLYWFLNDHKEAEKYLLKVKDLIDSLPEADFLLAKINISRNDYQAAQNILEAIDYPGHQVELEYERGRVYYNLGDKAKAKSSFEFVVENEPSHANALYSLGLIYEETGDYQAALGFFDQVLISNPGNQELIQKIETLKNY